MNMMRSCNICCDKLKATDYIIESKININLREINIRFPSRVCDCYGAFHPRNYDYHRINLINNRYQRVSPYCLPLSNARKPTSRSCKEEDLDSSRGVSNYHSFEGKPLSKFVSTSSPSNNDQDQNCSSSPFVNSSSLQPENQISKNRNDNESSSSGGDILLQWGHKKRSRLSRTEKSLANRNVSMPPPLSSVTSSYNRGSNLRPCVPFRESQNSLINNRISEERTSSRSGPSPSKPHSRISKIAPGAGGIAKPGSDNKPNGRSPPRTTAESTPSETEHASNPTDKASLEQFECPRIYLALSRKEKEDDFLIMKGTKLPQRPKKRPKNIDKTLQYIFPGMWLSDLSRSRYEVREKKCVKKKRKGLKGLENMDSDFSD